MPIRIKPEYETFNDINVLGLNMMEMYAICMRIQGTYEIPNDVFDDSGYVYLYQAYPDNEREERKRRRHYDEISAKLGKMTTDTGVSLPPYEELAEFDGLIFIKAAYERCFKNDGTAFLRFGEIIPIDPDEQLTYDEYGNIVKASIFD